MKDISSDMIRDFMKKPITAVSTTLPSKTVVVETRQLVVMLPTPPMSGYTESGNHPAIDLYSYDSVKSAIEAAGGTVKP
ncbi:hypothetical protein WG29040_23250 [Pseudomonas sp. PAMC 29040]|uniref:hypothetical protein n=1 Tax=Pseudomonas sp. PAMC 29040 TaxID=2498450 RepID=UPI000FBB10AE|nr:hypothetical protein [Pseudomonas sp. PAMC 29040]RUT30858.1 hypothetical protein WG29040_23250 [Pseudomonas sp. PAMC 29040]